MKKSSHNLSSFLFIPVMLVMLSGACTSPGNDIRLRDSSQVDRVLISDGIDSVRLLKTEEGWTLGSGEQLNDVIVENVLFSASRLQISSIVTKTSLGHMNQRNISYYRGHKLLLSYTLGNDNGEWGTVNTILKKNGEFTLSSAGSSNSNNVTIKLKLSIGAVVTANPL